MTNEKLQRANEIQRAREQIENVIERFENGGPTLSIPKTLIATIWKKNGFKKFMLEVDLELKEEFEGL